MVEFKLQRLVDTSVFRLTPNLEPEAIEATPLNKPVT
jgi:hypothetical protein